MPKQTAKDKLRDALARHYEKLPASNSDAETIWQLMRRHLSAAEFDELGAKNSFLRALSQIANENGAAITSAGIQGASTYRSNPRFSRAQRADKAQPCAQALLAKQNLNLLLEGVPGTGKTYAFGQICRELNVARSFVLNCHPSTQYEDVIEGLRPQSVRNVKPWQPVDGTSWQDSQDGWHVVDGVFLQACTAARNASLKEDGTKSYVAILLDELNRANVPRMLGDLLTVMERSKRATFDVEGKLNGETPPFKVNLPISGRTFLVPDNLIIVATMNSVDHSVAPLDQALLRRFWRVRVEPKGFELENPIGDEQLKSDLKLSHKSVTAGIAHYRNLNRALSTAFGPDAMIGHSYLTDMQALCNAESETSKHSDLVQNVWRYSVAPQVIAAVQAAGKEVWFETGGPTLREKDKTDYDELVKAMTACGLQLECTGAGAARALRMKPV